MKYTLFFLAFFALSSFAQNTPLLERRVNLSFESEQVATILSEMGAQAEFIPSYNPEIFENFGLQSIQAQDASVRHVLNSLFQNQIHYRVRGRYLIIQRNEAETGKAADAIVEGYLYDSHTGDILANASVYSAEQRLSAITDEFGYFKLQIPPQDEILLKISKLGYADADLLILEPSYNYVKLELGVHTSQPQISYRDSHTQSLKHTELSFGERMISNDLLIHARNISDTIFRHYQFSVFPGLSTNRFLSGNTVNRFSLNLSLGYTQSVEILELGAIGNIVLEDAGLLQAAGIFNTVGGKSMGLQAAGILNQAIRLDGVQAAGIVNVLGADGRSLQAAGVCNLSGNRFTGLQAAGVFNRAQSMRGLQAAGVFNITQTESEATQVSGVFNVAGNIIGAQVAGIFNKADSVEGVQIAGIFNRAAHIKGYQLGLINVADTIDGIPIGLLSWVKNGYNRMEIYADELFLLNLGYRLGVKRFHNVLGVGMLPGFGEKSFWAYHYGFGFSLGKSERFSPELEFSGSQIVYGLDFAETYSLNRAGLGAEIRLQPTLALYVGLHFNLLSFNSYSPESENLETLIPYQFHQASFPGGWTYNSWIGLRVGVRFF